MKVLQQDTIVTHDYSGQVKSMDAVIIKPKVSGSIVEKYFRSGQFVHEGDPLYKIDDRQYDSAVLSARSNVDKARTNLNNSMIDLGRYEKLLSSGAIAEQTVTTQRATVASNQSSYDDAQALLKKAQENLDDTVIRAPITGKLSVDDVAAGTYVTAGNTSLVSIGSINPIYVQFSISENEYLNFRMAMEDQRVEGERLKRPTPPKATLTLSNGRKYDEVSTNYIGDRELSESTGTLTLKAVFQNEHGVLLPGMFARVTVEGSPRKDALLVPQRAVQQVLDKSFVIVVGDDNKSVSKLVTLGDQVGSYYIVESGLSKDDNVVVEGLTNLKEGQPLNATETTAEELGLSLTAPDSAVSVTTK
ncbi:efflux RND transporter periplasmic adaptor subunit [Dialister sp.]|uniref:efflux RND transporter periplasmic adaptor subunit n=1 Tax=Dialister sp. TaxID=1955814 RepID=UPI002E81AC53|nr:efflux RND transporter periplasmic adaptor subunit [Dialister sp.]MEE3453273.1 efflux RND transporter periplasmic adaptor subunit [Dialister sp.]